MSGLQAVLIASVRLCSLASKASAKSTPSRQQHGPRGSSPAAPSGPWRRGRGPRCLGVASNFSSPKKGFVFFRRPRGVGLFPIRPTNALAFPQRAELPASGRQVRGVLARRLMRSTNTTSGHSAPDWGQGLAILVCVDQELEAIRMLQRQRDGRLVVDPLPKVSLVEHQVTCNFQVAFDESLTKRNN